MGGEITMSEAKKPAGSRRKKETPREELRRTVVEGYRKLALGPVGDAVKLMMAEEGERLDYAGLDLLNLAEMRRGKGVIELKFFDRLEALDRLAQLAREEESGGLDRFCAALSQGAKELYRKEREEGGDDGGKDG